MKKTLRELLNSVDHKDSRAAAFTSLSQKEKDIPSNNDTKAYPWCPIARAISKETSQELLSRNQIEDYLKNIGINEHEMFYTTFDKLMEKEGACPVRSVAEALDYYEKRLGYLKS